MRKLNGNSKSEETISIDAGLSGTGLAHWAEEDWFRCVNPTRVVNLYARQANDLIEKAAQLTYHVLQEIKGRKVLRAYIEFPRHFESTKGTTAEAQGDIIKLAYLVGCFATALRARGVEVFLVGVNEWKGQLPKDIVERRIIATLPDIKEELNPTSHSWDATGIGLWAKGFLNQ